MSKNIKIILGIVFALILLSIIFSGASDKADEAIRKVETKDRPTISYEVRQDLKVNYMIGCSEDGDYEYCNCTFEYLVSELGWDGLMEVMMDYYLTRNFPKIMIDAAFHCIDLME